MANKVIEIEEKKILYINEYHTYLISDISQYFAIILNYDTVSTIDFLRAIRSSFDTQVSMIPCLLFASKRVNHKLLESLTDGVITQLPDVNRYISEFEEIHNIVNTYNKLQNSANLELINILRFTHSRQFSVNSLNPVVSDRSGIGYIYPIVWAQYTRNHTQNGIDILKKAERFGYLKSSFVDLVHLCPVCLSGHYNIREVCKSCGSADLVNEATIHHFVCANIAPESEYITKDNELICPQCNRYLKNIGIDYDKPSLIHKCLNCNYQFQQPDMNVFCYKCQSMSAVEDLIPYRVCRYELTSRGVDALTKNITDNSEPKEQTYTGFIKSSVLKTLISIERRNVLQLDQKLIVCFMRLKLNQATENDYEKICNKVASLTPEYVNISQRKGLFSFLFPSSFYLEDVNTLCQDILDIVVEFSGELLEQEVKYDARVVQYNKNRKNINIL